MKDLPSPRQLRYLIALSETMHFGRAAEACAVTQSTLSSGLKELETILGVTLVERSQRSVLVTPLGRMIAARARESLQYLVDLVDFAQSSKPEMTGQLNLGVIPTIGRYLLPSFLLSAKNTYPGLKIFVREEQTAPLLARLRDGTLDAALVALPYPTPHLEVDVVGEEDVALCLPEGHPLARHATIRREDLADIPLLTLEDGHCLREHALSVCTINNPLRNEVYQATSLATLVQMVRTGLGAALLPRMAVATETANCREVCVRAIKPHRPVRQIALVWRDTAVKAAEYRQVAEILRRSFKDTQAA